MPTVPPSAKPTTDGDPIAALATPIRMWPGATTSMRESRGPAPMPARYRSRCSPITTTPATMNTIRAARDVRQSRSRGPRAARRRRARYRPLALRPWPMPKVQAMTRTQTATATRPEGERRGPEMPWLSTSQGERPSADSYRSTIPKAKRKSPNASESALTASGPRILGGACRRPYLPDGRRTNRVQRSIRPHHAVERPCGASPRARPARPRPRRRRRPTGARGAPERCVSACASREIILDRSDLSVTRSGPSEDRHT